jgi:DNA-directed RNA polymerase subunit H (RpoH/RPB5)
MSSPATDSPEKVVSEKGVLFTTSHPEPVIESDHLHFASRGNSLPAYDTVSDDKIVGYDSSLMRDRTLLSSDEERRLLRQIDWRLLPLLALMYMIKTIDAANVSEHRIERECEKTEANAQKVSNARIMDKGTKRNILTELHITSNQYNLVTVCYYVRFPLRTALGSILTRTKIPYIVAEAPFNLLVKYAKPSVWQARVMVVHLISRVFNVPNSLV